jgi:hypothetical protein
MLTHGGSASTLGRLRHEMSLHLAGTAFLAASGNLEVTDE